MILLNIPLFRAKKVVGTSASAPPPSPPVNTDAPYLAYNDPLVFNNLVYVINGIWEGDEPITYTYQWTKDGVDMENETNDYYFLLETDHEAVMDCRVTATNSVGSNSETTSNPLTVFYTLEITLAPEIYYNEELSQYELFADAEFTPYTDNAVYSYNWFLNGNPVEGEIYTVFGGTYNPGDSIYLNVIIDAPPWGSAGVDSNVLLVPI